MALETQDNTEETTDAVNGDGDRDGVVTTEVTRPRAADRAVVSSAETPALVQWAGALLVAASLFAVAAIMAFGAMGKQSLWGWGFLVLGFLSLGGWFLGRRQGQSIGRDVHARQRILLGTNAFTSLLLFLVLLVGVNYIATRRHKVFDLTSNRVNSLSDQTYKALDQLPGPVTMTYVFVPASKSGQPDPAATALLNSYKNASDKVKVAYVNAFLDEMKLRTLNLNTFNGQPLLLVEMDNSRAAKGSTTAPGKPARQEVSVTDEQNVTSALLKLINPKPRTLYFLTGHGEMDPTAAGGMGQTMSLSLAKTQLEAQNYTIKTFSLLNAAKAAIPADAEAVVVSWPKGDLSAKEEKVLTDYVNGKGHLLLMLSPDRTFRTLPHWAAVAKALGLDVLGGEVMDPEHYPPTQVVGALGDPSRAELLRGVNGDVIFPGAVPMQKVKTAPPGLTVTSLFDSSNNSQSITLQGGRPTAGQKGPFVLAAAIERGAPAAPGSPPPPADTRAVVVGNASFAVDQALQEAPGNASFFLSAVNWVVGNQALVSIPPKPPVTNSLTMTEPVSRFVLLFSIGALPFLSLLVGAVVWWKRR